MVDGGQEAAQAKDAGAQGPAPAADAVADRQEGADQALALPPVVTPAGHAGDDQVEVVVGGYL